MFNFRAGLLLAVFTLASACTTLPARERAFDPALCNGGAAYEAGFNDGQDGRAMSSDFLNGCREDLRAQGQEGYRKGYDGGRVRFEERMKAMQSEQHAQDQPQPPTTINNNGIQVNVGMGQPYQNPYPRAWYCSVHAFTSDFEAFGPTQLEARQMTIQNCMRQFNPMHCQEVSCRPNR